MLKVRVAISLNCKTLIPEWVSYICNKCLLDGSQKPFNGKGSCSMYNYRPAWLKKS